MIGELFLLSAGYMLGHYAHATPLWGGLAQITLSYLGANAALSFACWAVRTYREARP